MESDFGDNYISLRQATKFCDHSQDYLNLLVRKGRLRAVKIGRNWVTKKEWLEEYLQRVEEKKIKRTQTTMLREPAAAAPDIKVCVPQPQAQTRFKTVYAAAKIERTICFKKLAQPAAVLVSCWVAAFLVAGSAFDFFPAHNFFATNVTPVPRQILAEAGSVVSRAAVSLGDAGKQLPFSKIVQANVSGGDFFVYIDRANSFMKSKILAFGDYLFHGKTEVVAVSSGPGVDRVVLQKSVDVLEQNITDDTKNRFDDFRKEFDVTGSVPVALPSAQQGAVVVPLTGDVASTEEEIKESFSDHVAVKPVDDTTGVIVPQFKDKQGQDYLYMMVPVKNN